MNVQTGALGYYVCAEGIAIIAIFFLADEPEGVTASMLLPEV